MIWRKPLISAIAFLVLLLLYGGDRWWTEHRRAAKERSERAFPFNKDDVTEMTLVTPKEIITVKKQKDGRWYMTQPLKTRADKDEIEVILGNIVPALRYGEFKMDETIKLEDYGLDAPTYKVTLKTKKYPQGLTLLVGKQAPQSGKFYAKIQSEDKIFSINEYIKNKLDKKPFDLRDRTVLHVALDKVRKAVLARAIKTPIVIKSSTNRGTTQTTEGWQRRPREEIVIAKTDDGEWRLEKPVPWRADRTEIENLLRKLKTEKVKSFIDQPSTTTDYGLSNPQIEVRVEQIASAGDGQTTSTTKTETLVLVVGDRVTSPGKGYYARRDDKGPIVTIGYDLFDALAIEATKLRDKQLFSLAAADVARFEIQCGKSRVVLEKNDKDRWVFADDPATSVDQEIVEEKLSELVNLRAKDFETDNPKDLSPYKLDKPYVRLAISDKDHKTTEGIDMGDLATRDGESVVFAKPLNLDSVVLLDFTKPSEFALTKNDLKDKSLFSFDEKAVVKAEVFEAPATSFTLFREKDAWKMKKEGDKKARHVSTFWAEDVVRGVRELKYHEIYKGKLTEKEMGLTSPTLRVALFDKQGNEVARVVRGLRKGGRYYTKIRSEGPVYGIKSSRFGTLDSAVENLLKQ